MLEAKNLTKIYKPKKGIPVTALDGVDIRFPKTGMVFLLGKSGSGKSTLLNMLGGLDKYDDGEITVNGVSSKTFKQEHFDSLRNTYIGFIFQEYNILDDFNVGANIALAIELQGRKASDDEINEILKEVDLEGFGNRKPNELSGGQKQRVAIARALVKKPQIIMADEPTGALDSATGKQVFDTLKKLSKDKLVIVVSHDREFAEGYADRIVELSDGKIISDVELDTQNNNEDKTPDIDFDSNVITVKSGYHLTEDDRTAINEYIDKLNTETKITVNSKKRNRFIPTDTAKIEKDTDTFNLIKSKLPLKNAFKIGASGLKHKKFRLVITVLLSCIAFGLFGFSDTMGSYDHIRTCTNSMYDTGIKYASVVKSKYIGKGKNKHWQDYNFNMSDSDISEIYQKTGVRMKGVFMPKNSHIDFSGNTDNEKLAPKSEYYIYRTDFNGYTEINKTVLDNLGYKILAGTLPDGQKDEIAISEYAFEVLKKGTYTDGTKVKDSKGYEAPVYTEIRNYKDIIGKTLSFNDTKYTVTAVIDTGLDLERYLPLTEEKKNQSTAQRLLDYALYNEFNCSLSYNFSGAVMVGEGKVKSLIEQSPKIYNISNGYLWFNNQVNEEYFSLDPQFLSTFADVGSQNVVWINGEKNALGDKEIIVTQDCIAQFPSSVAVYDEQDNIDYVKSFQKLGAIGLQGYLYGEEDINESGYTVVGYIPSNENTAKIQGTIITSERVFNMYCCADDGAYSFAVGAMPEEKSEIKKLVAYSYSEDTNVRFPIQNSVTYELDAVNEAFATFSKIAFYVGLGFALFAALMLANFISTSISYKKQEIGILRAIGSRSRDVFRIFFAESFIIAMINFVISAFGVFAITLAVNKYIRLETGALITVLNFTPRQAILLFAVSLLVAFLASFIPVKIIASKKPIDAIRDR